MLVVCSKCLYEWNYKGKMAMATCPNCGKKVAVKDVEKYREQLEEELQRLIEVQKTLKEKLRKMGKE